MWCEANSQTRRGIGVAREIRRAAVCTSASWKRSHGKHHKCGKECRVLPLLPWSKRSNTTATCRRTIRLRPYELFEPRFRKVCRLMCFPFSALAGALTNPAIWSRACGKVEPGSKPTLLVGGNIG